MTVMRASCEAREEEKARVDDARAEVRRVGRRRKDIFGELLLGRSG
jgi:hypothetical protein